MSRPEQSGLVDEAAARLREAQRSRTPIDPLTVRYPGQLDVDAAWQVQSINRDLALSGGRTVRGYKVGLTSAAMQAQMGVDTPDFGVLLDDMQIADNGVMRLDEFVQPRIEAEIALVLAHDLGAGATVQDVLDGAEQAFPALEIIDSRIRDWRLTLIDTVADNASSGAYVLGPPVPARRFELGDVEVVLNLNGVERARGFGSAALGHPAAAAAWLANRLADFGTTLTAGSVVLTGSLHASLPLARDDRVQADFGEFGSANVVVG